MMTCILVSLAILITLSLINMYYWQAMAEEATTVVYSEYRAMVEAQEAAREANRVALALEAVPTPTPMPKVGAIHGWGSHVRHATIEDLVTKDWSLNMASEQVVCTHGTHQYAVDLGSECAVWAEVERTRMDMCVGTYDEQVYEDECVMHDAREYKHGLYTSTHAYGKGKDSMQVVHQVQARRQARGERRGNRDMDSGCYMVTTSDMQVAATTPKRDKAPSMLHSWFDDMDELTEADLIY